MYNVDVMKKISYLFVLSLSALCFSSCTPSNVNTITPSESIIPETQVNEDGKPIHNSHNIDSHNTDSGNTGSETTGKTDDSGNTGSGNTDSGNTGSGTTGTLSDDINAYYATITDSMSGDTLKSKLSDIVTKGHTKYDYDKYDMITRFESTFIISTDT